MSEMINMTQNENNVYEQDEEQQKRNIISVQNTIALSEKMKTVNAQLDYELKVYSHYVLSMENINQRYLNAEANKQWAYNNETSKYNTWIEKQNNLLTRINNPEIKLWRYKNQLYYRTNSGELINDNQVEIQKELSSRYGSDVYIVYDMNDILT